MKPIVLWALVALFAAFLPAWNAVDSLQRDVTGRKEAHALPGPRG